MSEYINKDFNLGYINLLGTKLDIQKYLNRSYDNIYHASVDLPVVLQFLSDSYQEYKIRLLNKRNHIKRLEAKLYLRIKQYGMADMGFSGKITEETVLRAIALDPEISEQHDRLSELSGMVSWIQATMDTFRYKLEMVRSQEATNRNFYTDSKEDSID